MTPEPKEQAVPVVGVEEVVAQASYMVGNPSAWEAYDDRASEVIRKLLDRLKALSQPYRGGGLAHSPAAHPHRATEQPVVGWRPIESAPKDGTEIFVWGVTECSPLSRPHIGCDDIERVRWDGHGWEVSSAQAEFIWVCEPTHWMPLPAGPDANSAAEQPGTQSRSDEVNHLQAQLKAAYEALEEIADAAQITRVRHIARQALARRGEGQ